MRRLLVPTGVLVLAAMSGAAIAGRPAAVADDVSADALSVERSIGQITPTTSMTAATSTTSTSTTSTSTTSTSSTTTVAPTTSIATSEVRVVVADSGAGDAVRPVADGLRAAGYTDVVLATATTSQATSTLLYHAGFEGPADELARLLGIDDVRLRPFATVTELDERGDVWVLVGVDHT